MFKKILFTLVISIALPNHLALAMMNFENFEEKKPAKITIAQIKKIYKDAEFSDESSERKFKLTCQEKNMDLVETLDDTIVIPGIWSSMEKGWLFQFILKKESGMPVLTEENRVSGIIFVIKEIK